MREGKPVTPSMLESMRQEILYDLERASRETERRPRRHAETVRRTHAQLRESITTPVEAVAARCLKCDTAIVYTENEIKKGTIKYYCDKRECRHRVRRGHKFEKGARHEGTLFADVPAE